LTLLCATAGLFEPSRLALGLLKSAFNAESSILCVIVNNFGMKVFDLIRFDLTLIQGVMSCRLNETSYHTGRW